MIYLIATGLFLAVEVFARDLRSIQSSACNARCVHGKCVFTDGNKMTCLCSEVYAGNRCERVNMRVIDVITVGNSVILKWPVQPVLTNFSLVYFRVHDSAHSDVTITKKPIRFPPDETSLLVDTFDGVLKTYRVCIESTSVANVAVATQSSNVTTNCRDVTTQIDYHSLAGWFLSFIFCLTAVLLICCQRDKIELIYFNRPWNLNVGYNYNVEELIRNEKMRKEKESGLQLDEAQLNGNEAAQTTVGNSSLGSIDELKVYNFVRSDYVPTKQHSLELETIFDDNF